MRSERPGPPSPPPSPPQVPAVPEARMDPMTHVSHPSCSAEPSSSSCTLCPVHVEGLGRVVMPPAMLGEKPSPRRTPPTPSYAPRLGGASGTLLGANVEFPSLAWPDAPDNAWRGTCDAIAQQAKMRRHGIEHWLMSPSASESDDEESDSAADHFHHPMVAKFLRDQCRAHRMRRLRHTHVKDLWISSDGHRAPRPTSNTPPKRRIRRRVALTSHTLAARGIAPVMGCRCGFTDQHMDMVQCDGCTRWLHLACVGVGHVDQLGTDEWVCDDCYDRSMSDEKRAASNDSGLAQHGAGAMLSLAPSPRRETMHEADVVYAPPYPRPSFSAESSGMPLTSPLSSSASDRAWRTPSPPPSMDMFTTPSRYVPPDVLLGDARMRRMAPHASATPPVAHEFLPTPSRYLMQTPQAGVPTPMFGTHTPHGPRAVHEWAMRTPGELPSSLWATPHDLLNGSASAWGATQTPFASGSSPHSAHHDAWAHPESPTPATRGARARHAMATGSPHRVHASPHKATTTPRHGRWDALRSDPPASSPLFGAGHDGDESHGMPSSSPYPVTPTLPSRDRIRPRAAANVERAGMVMNLHLDRAAPKPRLQSELLPSLSSFMSEEV